MVKFAHFLLLLTLLASGLGTRAEEFSVRVGTLNLAHDQFKYPQDEFRYQALLKSFGSALSGVDIVSVQELASPSIADPLALFSDKYLKILADASGLSFRYAAKVAGDPTYFNTGILSRFPIVANSQQSWDFDSTKLTTATVQVGARFITFYAVRLPPSAGPALLTRLAGELIAHIKAEPVPANIGLPTLVIAGDFNSALTDPPFRLLTTDPALNLQEALTVSATPPAGCNGTDPQRVNDFIFFNGPYTVADARCQSIGSDHPFVSATLHFKSPVLVRPGPPDLPDPRDPAACKAACDADFGDCAAGSHAGSAHTACIGRHRACLAACNKGLPSP